jgi:two-component system, OmpR family, sensor kinase
MSLRRRLLVGIVAVAATLVVTNVLLTTTFQRYLVDRTDEQLRTTIARPIFTQDGRIDPPVAPGPGGEPLTDMFIGVADLRAGTLTRFGSAIREEEPPAVSAQELAAARDGRPFTATSEGAGPGWRLLVAPGEGSALLVVGVSLADVEATLDRLRTVQVAGTLAVLAVLAAVSLWVLRVGVRPVVAMAATAEAITAGDLGRRVEHVDPRTEAGRLGSAFNTMLSEIEESFAEREASEGRVRRFAADASHELRTPLTSIRGYVELWQAGGLREPGQLEEAMCRMAQESHRMSALVEDLLLLARLDERRPLALHPVRLDQLAEDGVRDARAVEPDRPVTVDVEQVTVEGDERHLRQIVANLLTNARSHTPPGTPIHVRVEAVDGRARLVVADEGPGMPPHVAARVFERFYRADPARVRGDSGTGLGLSIVRAVAAAHGGDTEVDTAPGAGCRFSVTLPLEVGSEAAGTASTAVGVSGASPG